MHCRCRFLKDISFLFSHQQILFGLKFNCVTNLKDLPDMRSEKVMVRLAPWKRSMECMREGRWNRVLDLECKSDQSEFHLKLVQFEIIFGQRQFSLRFDQLEWYFNDLNAYFVNFIKPWDWRCAGGGGLVHGGDVEDARDCGVVVDDLPVAHVPVREAAVEVEQEVVAGARFDLNGI